MKVTRNTRVRLGGDPGARYRTGSQTPWMFLAVEETVPSVGCTPKAATGERLRLSPADGTGLHGTGRHSLAGTFHRPDLLLLLHSASPTTLPPAAHWVGNGVLIFLLSAGTLRFEVGML